MTHVLGNNPNWRLWAPALVLCAGFAWGIIGLFSITLNEMGLSKIQISAVRCIIAAACFGAYLLAFDRAGFRIRLRDAWMFLGTGVLSIALFNVCYFGCIEECNLSIACVLLYTAPCFVTLLSRALFGELLTRRKLLCLACAFCGCAFVAGIGSGNGSASLAGIIMGLGSGLGYALYSIFGNLALGKGYSPLTVTFYTFVFATLALVPFGNPAELLSITLGNPVATSVFGPATSPLAVMLMIGVLCTVVPFVCYTNGLAHMEASRASIMAFVEPMVALLIGALVFRDALTPLNYLGIAMIAGAVLALNLPSKATRSANNPSNPSSPGSPSAAKTRE